ncbi:MAG: DUF177 domain-containing protein [Candidatus Omnitrophota bacterium]
MKIPVDHIPDSGLEIQEDLRPGELNVNRPDIAFSQAVNLSGRITKGLNTFGVDLKIKATMQLTCNRCLDEFTLPLEKKIHLDLPMADLKIIDLDEQVHDEIMLGFPLKPLCCKDCRGLCPRCGQNLNEGKCKCK